MIGESVHTVNAYKYLGTLHQGFKIFLTFGEDPYRSPRSDGKAHIIG